MERHLSHTALIKVFSGQAALPVVRAAIPHLARCSPCWSQAAQVVAKLRRTGGVLIQPPDALGALLALFAEEERDALTRLRARAAWAELKSLSFEEQAERIRQDESLQTQEMFETVCEEASSLTLTDPYLGEETALLAHTLANCLPETEHPEAFRSDLCGESMILVANCRRLRADWRGAGAALASARRLLERGTGDLEREARLLSMQASLATDTGHLEEAGAFLAHAASIYKKAGDLEALATAAVQEANTLLAACRHEESIARAEEALRHLTAKDIRLEALARYIVTASFVFLDRPAAALRSYLATWDLRENLGESRFELQSGYLEALLLDSFGYAREAEKAYRSNVERRMEAELYKDAFLTLLTRFEFLFRRGDLDKAARACEEALGTMRQAGAACHSQMEELWRGLLALVRAHRLSEHHLLAARRYLARHWNLPARHEPLELTRVDLNGASPSRQEPTGSEACLRGVPVPLGVLEPADYEAALERYDRQLIVAGLGQCGGRVGETSRLLGISRNTLRGKLAKYDLVTEMRNDTEGEGTGTALDALRDEERETLNRLRARAWWAELKRLSAGERQARIRSVLALRTRELFDTILDEASVVASSDPELGEDSATLAYGLAGILPPSRCTEPVRNDLQAAALIVVANCQRLAGGWHGSSEALDAARGHLQRGTGDAAREARLLSMQASLATDMGHYEKALALLRRASAIYRGAQNTAGFVFTAIQEANTLLAGYRHSEAIVRAEEALRVMTPRQIRLEILARSIITSSLVFLGRPTEALRSLHAARPLYMQFRARSTDFQLTYLEALVLDSLGLDQEAEFVFRANVQGRLEAGLYKDAFLTLLTRVELLFRRGELDKSAGACQEAIELMEGAGAERHAQTIALFRDLLALIDSQRLTEPRLREARTELVRSWAAPAQPAPPAKPAREPKAPRGRGFLAPEPPPLPARLQPGDYEAARERYEREVILKGLAQAQGRIRETCRLLGISRNMLRERMARYGLRETGDSR